MEALIRDVSHAMSVGVWDVLEERDAFGEDEIEPAQGRDGAEPDGDSHFITLHALGENPHEVLSECMERIHIFFMDHGIARDEEHERGLAQALRVSEVGRSYVVAGTRNIQAFVGPVEGSDLMIGIPSVAPPLTEGSPLLAELWEMLDRMASEGSIRVS